MRKFAFVCLMFSQIKGKVSYAHSVHTGQEKIPSCFLFCCRSFDRAVEEWRQFHCDMNDLSQWLTDTERLMSESVGPDGQLDLDSARQHQEVSGRWSSTWRHHPWDIYKSLRIEYIDFLISTYISDMIENFHGIQAIQARSAILYLINKHTAPLRVHYTEKNWEKWTEEEDVLFDY